jgi:hypothetical protein
MLSRWRPLPSLAALGCGDITAELAAAFVGVVWLGAGGSIGLEAVGGGGDSETPVNATGAKKVWLQMRQGRGVPAATACPKLSNEPQ